MKLCSAGAGESEENKQHQGVPREWDPKASPIWVPAVPCAVGESSQSSWPWHPCVQPQFSGPFSDFAPFKEGLPGIAQSVTFVCFLWSALLNYFLSKRPRNLIGEMRRWVWSGRIIMKNCHFPGCSFVGPPAFWDKDTAAGLGSILKGRFGCLIIYEILILSLTYVSKRESIAG